MAQAIAVQQQDRRQDAAGLFLDKPAQAVEYLGRASGPSRPISRIRFSPTNRDWRALAVLDIDTRSIPLDDVSRFIAQAAHCAGTTSEIPRPPAAPVSRLRPIAHSSRRARHSATMRDRSSG